MTHRERMLRVLRGEDADALAYAPRFDIWYNASSISGTLPANYAHSSPDEIARSEGWALHKQTPDFLRPESEDDMVHRGLGLFSVREMCFRCSLPPDVAVSVVRDGPRVTVTYSTPLGEVRTTTVQDTRMGLTGASLPWVQEYAIKTVEDYQPLAYIFDGLQLVPDYTRYSSWREGIGTDGVAVTMASMACSPMHHIQHDLIDATDFFYHYSDNQPELQRLASSISTYYEQALGILKKAQVDAVLWGGNVDEVLTYPDYFRREILPWLQKAADELREAGIPVTLHCDGENARLIDLIRDSHISGVEGLCPAPMTRLPLRDYYQAWSPHLAVWGGIPSATLVPELFSEEEFDAFLDEMFLAVVPGTRFIVGFGDTAPPGASFDRMVRIGERVRADGRLPLAVKTRSSSAVMSADHRLEKEARPADRVGPFVQLWREVQAGKQDEVAACVDELLDKGFQAEEILIEGLVAPMEDMGEKFAVGEVFIPELLLSARAANSAIDRVAPLLASRPDHGVGKVVIGTVEGDLHDLGKNLVTLMLRSAGFEVVDVGVNVEAEEFVRLVCEHKPLALGLSSLLTTTMSEMKRVIQKLEERGVRNSVLVIVGGAPVTNDFATLIGADGYAADAAEAVSLLRTVRRPGTHRTQGVRVVPSDAKEDVQ